MRFGISTHLYLDQPLSRPLLAQVADYGFEAIELFAARPHFDYRDEASAIRLGEWLREAGLTLHSVHAPISERFEGGQWGPMLSTAAADATARQHAVHEAELALRIARHVPFEFFVVHLGSPAAPPAVNNRAAAARSAEDICRLAEPFGVKVAFEVIPNDLSTTDALVRLLERDLDIPHAGLCLDFGHANILGDVADQVETAAEHLWTTHVHDNRGRSDDHLVPYAGTINWDTALVTMQKIGYEGTYVMELARSHSPAEVLEDARRARQRFAHTLSQP